MDDYMSSSYFSGMPTDSALAQEEDTQDGMPRGNATDMHADGKQTEDTPQRRVVAALDTLKADEKAQGVIASAGRANLRVS